MLNSQQLSRARSWLTNQIWHRFTDYAEAEWSVSQIAQSDLIAQINSMYPEGIETFLIATDPDVLAACRLDFLVAEDIRGYHAWYYQPKLNMYLAVSEDDSENVLLTPRQYEEESNGRYVAGRDIRDKLLAAGYTADPRHNQREEDKPKLKLTPEQLMEARDWIKDCKWAEDFDGEDIDEMSDAEIEKGIAKHYEGGIIDFQNSCAN